MTQGLAEAGRDRENIRSELLRMLEAARLGNSEQDGGAAGMGYPAPEPRGALIRRTRCFDTSHISVAPPLGPGVRPPASPPPRRSTGEQSACDSRHSAGSCEQCPTPWLPFQGSCYLFSKAQATWNAAQESCAGAGAHLVIVGDLDEQVRSPAVGAWPGRWAGREAGSQAQWLLTPPPQGFLSQYTRGHGYWLGLRAVRRGRGVQGYQWVDGVTLSFR